MNKRDVMALVEKENREQTGNSLQDDRTWYAVKPYEMYTAMLDYLRECQRDSTKIVDALKNENGSLVVPMQEAMMLREEDFDTVDQDRRDLSTDERARRANVLEACRRCFDYLLSDAAGGAVGIHILRDEGWRL